MIVSLRSFLFICLLQTIAFGLSGQVIEPSLVFTTKDGLPQIQTGVMMQDSRGYIWAGTKSGLAKYNGSTWKSVDAENKLNYALLGEISNGNICALVNKDGLSSFYIYDGVKMKPSAIKLFDPSIFNSRIVNDTLYHVNILDSKVYKYDLRLGSLVGEKFIDISKYRLAGYSKKFGLVLSQKINSTSKALVKLEDLEVIRQVQLGSTFLSPKKVGMEIFTSFNKGYVEYYNLDDFGYIGKVKFLNGYLKDAQFETSESFYFSDKENNYRYNPISNEIDVLEQINSTSNIFLEDRDGSLWNSSESGIQLFPKINFVDYTQRELSDAWIFQSYQGDFIYGNYTGGLKRVQFNPYSVERLKGKATNRIYFGPSLMEGKLYIPGSVYISVIEGDKLDHIDVGKFNTPLLCSFYDEQTKSIFFGGLKSLLQLSQDESLAFHQDKSEVFSRYVLTIKRFDEDHLIFGTSVDLCLFNTENQEFLSLSHLFPIENFGGVTSLEKDNRGNFWIGNKKGLWYYNVSADIISRIAEETIQDNVMSIIQVKENLLAIGSSKNLIYLELDEFYTSGQTFFKAFNFMNGFHGEEVAQNGMSIQDSILWIPSATNLVSTNVNKLDFTPYLSNILISSINNNGLSFNIDETQIIDMTYGTKDLEIEYEAIGLNQPSESSYQYRLVGHSDNWSPWTSSTKANFGNLRSGVYEFCVKTRPNSDFAQDLPEKKILIRVDMPFYEEPNFNQNALFIVIIMLSLIALLLYTLYHRQIAKLELDKQFKLLQVQTLQLQMNPHFLFNVLGSIQSLILNRDIDNANKYLVSFSKMIRRYLDYNVSAYKSLEANSTDAIKISLQEEFDILKIYLEFEKLQLDDKFEYEIHIDDDVDANEIQIPPLIIQPLIENCIKHGIVPKKTKSFIQLNASRKDSGILIVIKDDGIGVSRSLELQKTAMKEFKSLSLRLINERIELLNSMGEFISLEIIDQPNHKGVEQMIFIDQIQNET